tara:strand:+ start:218 stop:442 length:225 start_codon:yes stop_codon:yes gene_type:complete
MLIIKHRKVFGGYLILLGILVLLFLACAPKQTEMPKQYTPPELTDEDLEVEEDIGMIEDLEDLDTAEQKAEENE